MRAMGEPRPRCIAAAAAHGVAVSQPGGYIMPGRRATALRAPWRQDDHSTQHLTREGRDIFHARPAQAYSVESSKSSLSSTRPTRISAVRGETSAGTRAQMSASVPVTLRSSGQLAR